MKQMKLYEAGDKMISLIKDNYSLLQSLGSFGINLGFGDKTVSETCELNNVDTYTFLAVVNFTINGYSNFEDDAQGAARDAKRAGIQVNVLGIGSSEPVTIPTGNPGEVMLDDEGNVAYTKLNEEMAQSIADAGGGEYIDGLATDAVSSVHDTLDKLSKSNLGTYTYTQHSELFPVFAWIALLLLLLIMLLTPRKTPWLSKINFFSNEDGNNE